MTVLRSDYLNLLHERGFLHQITETEALDRAFASEVVTAYIGFDATADSLHVGGLLQIMLLRHLQRTGHRPIVLMGGGTTKIGDPSLRDEARPLLDDEQISKNTQGIKAIFSRYLTFGDGKTDAIMSNNALWLDQLSYIPFLRDVGRHFTINRMLSFDSVKLRISREQPLTFLEFNYMILQAYDFVELHRRHGCILQMGGSDQWGNIVNGVELGRRLAQAELFGLTSPLLTTSSGSKMGKTAAGAIWLNSARLPAYDFWQYWRNTEDTDVGRFLRLFTEIPLDEVKRLESLGGAEINEAKKILALEVTRLAHGDDAAQAAVATARSVFEDGATGEDLPTRSISAQRLAQGVPLTELLCETGLVPSRGDAKRLIRGGGARINDQPVTDERALVHATHSGPDGWIRLSAGRKKHARIQQLPDDSDPPAG